MQSRVAKLRDRLAASNLDAIVVTHPSNRFYLTGFSAQDIAPNESSGHVVIGHDRAVLVTSFLNADQARQQAPDFEIVDRTRVFAEAAAKVLQEIGAKRAGFEDTAILYSDHRTLANTLGDTVELVPVGPLVDNLRTVKTPGEIERIAHAIAVTDRALEQVAATLQEGQTEQQMAWRLEVAMRELGAEDLAFPSIVASGPNAARPHHEPGERAIRAGEPIVIDMGALVNGYCADLTRTIWLGEPEAKLREVYRIVLDALLTAEASIRPGMTGKEADAAARDIIVAAGYGEAFGHSLGHGLGVRVHEGPSLSVRSEERLEPGNVVTIEPGIYLPGWGGVRIEDVAVIEENGLRVLTGAPKLSIESTTEGT